MIVDSCVHNAQYPALEYLAGLGVDAATAVKLIVATHWHDDHVRGITQLVTACTSAVFACSAALSPDELIQAIGRVPDAPGGKATSGVQEMKATLDAVATGARPAKWALQERDLYERPSTTEQPVQCRVRALSPSDSVLRSSFVDVAELLAQCVAVLNGGQEVSSRVARPDRNRGAVVLCVELAATPSGATSLVLGADLQEAPGGGWTAVLGVWGARGRSAEIFKVPHHGSHNGHHDRVWKDMLVETPEAVICPHENGSNQLPTGVDLARLCALSPKVHITARIERKLSRERGRLMEPSVPAFGRVTLRRRLGVDSCWNANYDGEAGPACPTSMPGLAT